MKKIKSKSGETLVEVLVSILIITFTFLLLTNSITSSARVTEKAKNMNTGFQYSSNTPTDTTKQIKIVFSNTNIENTSTNIDIYQADTGEYYYQVQKETE